MRSRTGATLLAITWAALLSGCWYHRMALPSIDATAESAETTTEWAFFWKPVRADSALCDNGLQGVVVRGKWGFSLIRFATLGIVAPARLEHHCARAKIVDRATPPDTAPPAPPGALTAWSILWGAGAQYEPPLTCNGRAMASFRVKANPAFDLLSVVSGGAFSPARLGWACIPRNPAPRGATQ